MRCPAGCAHLMLALVAACAAASAFAEQDDSALRKARTAFVDVWPEALEGRWPADPEVIDVLAGYALWPDLRAAYYSARLDTTSERELTAFMQRFETLAPIRRLRYRYTDRLINIGDWPRFLDVYRTHYANAGIAAFDCAALGAILKQQESPARTTRALAQRLWRVGQSQHDACDPSFSSLKKNGIISEADIRARMQLALDAQRYGLAGYLADMLDNNAQRIVSRWRDVYRKPEWVLNQAGQRKTSYSEAQLVAAARKLALSDAPLASKLWSKVDKRVRFDREQRHAVRRHIGIAAAQDHEPDALKILDALPIANADLRVLEWRARTAMRHADWKEVLRNIARMPNDAQASDRWRYWEARALAENGQREVAARLMLALAQERSFYGFLAADRSDTDYAFAHRPLGNDAAATETMSQEPELIRARELFLVDQPARARAEWRRAMRGRSDGEKRVAALLAHQWQWHSQAITLLGEIAAYDDLLIRYPLAYRAAIDKHSDAAGISSTWVYGITRSESLFTRDVRSSAGAWGLMQLIPTTGKRIAAQIGVDWRGVDTLKQPETNIALGTHYLASLHSRFGQPALATAAYNAGPERVDRWLPDSGTLPADVWIETIAYDETRSYVQRVLSAAAIFEWRMGRDVKRLSDKLLPVPAKQSLAPVASRL